MPLDQSTITPSIDDVAALIRTRTRSRGGTEVGTFDSTTRPTDSQAELLIKKAARHVSISVGERYTDWSEDLLLTAQDAVAAFAALYIEQSYYGDGSAPGDGPADQLGRAARETLGALMRDGGRGRLMRSVQFVDPADEDRDETIRDLLR